MPNLNDALKQQATIKEFANDFGFEDVRVFCDPNSSTLQLLVKAKKDAKQYMAPFEAWLQKQLNLNIEIMQEGNLKQLYKTSTLERSIPITDIDAIERIYQKKVTDVSIDSAPNDAESLNHRARAIALAEKILVSQNKPGIKISKIQFFSESTEEKADSGSANETKLKRKVEDLVRDVNTTDFPEVLKTIPDESFNKLEKQVQEAKRLRVKEVQIPSPTHIKVKGG